MYFVISENQHWPVQSWTAVYCVDTKLISIVAIGQINRDRFKVELRYVGCGLRANNK